MEGIRAAGLALLAEIGGLNPAAHWMTIGEAEDQGFICPPAPHFGNDGNGLYHYESLRSAALVIDGLIKDIFDGLETHPAYEDLIALKLHAEAARKLRRRQAKERPGQQTFNLLP